MATRSLRAATLLCAAVALAVVRSASAQTSAPTNVVLDMNAQANVITRGILNADVNATTAAKASAAAAGLGYLEQPLPSQTASRVLSLLNTAMLETLNVLVASPTFAGKPAKPLLKASSFAAADLAAANPAAAASFAGHLVLATLFPSRQQQLPPFLDSVVSIHLTDTRFGISLSLPADNAVIAASQRVGTFVARTILASKINDGFATLKTYSFNQTAGATSVPPYLQYRPAGIFPQAFGTSFVSSAGAFVYPQLQSVVPFVAAAGKDWAPNKNIKVLGVADPSKTSPYWKQAVTGNIYPNTLPVSDSNAVLGLWYNVSHGLNSTTAPAWAGYNFTSIAYPDPLYDAAVLAELQASLSITGLAPNPYYADLNQVRWLGQKNSVYRSPKQTNLAYFWRLGGNTGAVPGAFSAIATALLQANASSVAELTTGAGLYASAALLARLHVSIWDGCVAGWTAKYKYLHWRPETALRYGDNSSLPFNTTGYTAKKVNWPSEVTPAYATPTVTSDGTFTPLFNSSGSLTNAGPATDPTGGKTQLHAAWTPELGTPGHPEYPSTHAVGCEAAVTTLRLFFKTDSVTAINGGSPLVLNSEDTFLGNGTAPGDGGRPFALSGTLSAATFTFLNLSGVSGAGGAADTAPYTYSLPYGLNAITYSTLSALSRDCADSRVYGGIHFNSSVNDGIYLGNTVAAFVYAAYPGNLTNAVAAALPLVSGAASSFA